jgi:hypothetical protein
MLFQAIENANLRLIGDPEHNILDVHARREIVNGYQEITVAFEPTPDELRRLNEGKPVYVTQLGNSFHPIRVEVKA